MDGHNDTLARLDRHGASFLPLSGDGSVDYSRAWALGFGGGFFAIFAPDPSWPGGEIPMSDVTFTPDGYDVRLAAPIERSYALDLTRRLMRRLFQMEATSEGKLRIVRTADELDERLRTGAISAILHIEGAEAIDEDLSTLDALYQIGLRSLGPVWSRPNAFGHGVPFRFPSTPDTGPGLTDAGQRLVAECNRLGILLDLAHLNERGFWDVARLTDAPLVVTHSAVHAICPASRNLTDRQIDAVAASGGLIGIAFDVSMLRPDGGIATDIPLDVIARHIAYIADRVGIEHVALGSDFDGATLPDDLPGATGLPALMETLRAAGFDEASLRAITHENWLRVLRATWK